MTFEEYLASDEGALLSLQLRMTSPIPYLTAEDGESAPYWYVRHGMADRDIVELQNGDVIEPIFYYTNYSDIEDYFVSGEYVVNGDVDIIYEMLPDAEYIYSITLYDIYGNCYYAPEVTFEIEGEDFWYYPDELDNEDLGGLFDDAINNIIWGDLDQDDDEYDDSYSNVWNDLLGW